MSKGGRERNKGYGRYKDEEARDARLHALMRATNTSQPYLRWLICCARL